MRLRPHDLVHVREEFDTESGFVNYVGEVMSYPTPEGTVMVRRVPGFPGTLTEIPIDMAVPCDWRDVWVAVAVVGGPGRFPIDMLRYDRCLPLNFKIDDEGNAHLIEGLGDELLVACACETSYQAKVHAFTVERWRSFLWGLRVVKVERAGGAR